MRIARFAAVLVLCLFVATTGARAYHNEPTGFRGFAWGTPVDQVRAKVETFFNRDVGLGVVEYRSRDNLTANSIPLQYNFYQFYQGRFSGGIMHAAAAECSNMLKVLVARFGQPDRRVTANRYVWHGSTTTIGYICNRHMDYCRVGLESTKIKTERDNAIDRNVEKGGDDF